MTPQIFFSQQFDMGIKKAEFDADFISIFTSNSAFFDNHVKKNL